MQVKIHHSLIELVQGDITQQHVDAIVNAANSRLRGGGGVDGAIHRAGGPRILDECCRVGPCPTGEARMTGGGNLAARFVFHAVGPIYDGNPEQSALMLSHAYRACLELATQHQARSLAFPSISTGAYGYPVDKAAPVALKTVMSYVHEHHDIDVVRFVLFDERTFACYQRAMEHLVNER